MKQWKEYLLYPAIAACIYSPFIPLKGAPLRGITFIASLQPFPVSRHSR